MLKHIYLGMPSFWLYTATVQVAAGGLPSLCDAEAGGLYARLLCLSTSASGALAAADTGDSVGAGTRLLVSLLMLVLWGGVLPLLAMHKLVRVSWLQRKR